MLLPDAKKGVKPFVHHRLQESAKTRTQGQVLHTPFMEYTHSCLATMDSGVTHNQGLYSARA